MTAQLHYFIASFIVLCANYFHHLVSSLDLNLSIPIIHCIRSTKVEKEPLSTFKGSSTTLRIYKDYFVVVSKFMKLGGTTSQQKFHNKQLRLNTSHHRVFCSLCSTNTEHSTLCRDEELLAYIFLSHNISIYALNIETQQLYQTYIIISKYIDRYPVDSQSTI